jgi:hypothetical protein
MLGVGLASILGLPFDRHASSVVYGLLGVTVGCLLSEIPSICSRMGMLGFWYAVILWAGNATLAGIYACLDPSPGIGGMLEPFLTCGCCLYIGIAIYLAAQLWRTGQRYAGVGVGVFWSTMVWLMLANGQCACAGRGLWFGYIE